MTTPLTADECDAIIHAALAAHDVESVVAALRILAVRDPRRAQNLHDRLTTALAVAAVVRPDHQEA